jgi:alpha-glucoside transport system substrate-binding protein
MSQWRYGGDAVRRAMRRRHTAGRLTPITAVAAVTVLAASACGGASSGTSATEFSASFPPAQVNSAKAAALKATDGRTDLGGKVTLTWQTSGAENTLLVALLKPFTDATGIDVDVQSDPGMQTNLQAKVQAGNPPDVFIDSSAGSIQEYGNQLISMDSFLDMDAMRKDYSQEQLDAVSLNGHVKGIPGARNAIELWYNPKLYKGPTKNVTMSELLDWARKERDAGATAPFCGALSSGPFTANNASQFIDEIFGKQNGPDALVKFAAGEVPYSSPEVKRAIQTYLDLYEEGLVFGGSAYALSTPITSGTKGLLAKPQQCQLLPWGPFTESFIKAGHPKFKPGEDYDFFTLTPDHSGERRFFQDTGGWVTFAFHDDPQVRAFLKYFASTAFQTLVASTGHWLMANQQVPASAYPSPLLQRIANDRNDSTPIVGPFGTLPPVMRLTVMSAMQQMINDPTLMDDLLHDIDDAYSTYREQHADE